MYSYLNVITTLKIIKMFSSKFSESYILAEPSGNSLRTVRIRTVP